MKKEYLPFFNSLEQKYKDIYLEWSKEELIDHLEEKKKNGEVLLSRIEKAIEYIEHTQNYGKEKVLYVNGNDILKILKGETK